MKQQHENKMSKLGSNLVKFSESTAKKRVNAITDNEQHPGKKDRAARIVLVVGIVAIVTFFVLNIFMTQQFDNPLTLVIVLLLLGACAVVAIKSVWTKPR